MGPAFVLAAKSGLTDARALHEAISATPDLLVDASHCDLIGMATLQVLIAAASEHPGLRLIASEKIIAQLTPLGVIDLLPPAPDGADL